MAETSGIQAEVETSGIQAEVEIGKNILDEEQMDSTSLSQPNGEVGNQTTRLTLGFCEIEGILPSTLTNVESTEASTKIDAKKNVPLADPSLKIGAEGGAVFVEADINATAEVDDKKKINSNALVKEVVLKEDSVTDKDAENIQNVSGETKDTIKETQEVSLEDVEPITESCLKQSTDVYELNCSSDEQKEDVLDEILKVNGDKSSAASMDVTESEKRTDQKTERAGNSKEEYRDTIEFSDSDSESDSSETSSISSLSSPSVSDNELESEEGSAAGRKKKNKNGSYPVIRAKGELLPEDLPPIEELHISVPSSLCAEIGVVTSIVNTLVVIQSHKGLPALDLDSVLFLENGSRSLGLVFDVFGPVTEPLYCVRFNSAEHIAESNVKPGDKVFYAPQTVHCKYVFLQQLMKMRGSDASHKFDIEQTVFLEFSDDEEERRARTGRNEVDAGDEDQPKRKRDPNETFENKKKFAPHYSQRNQQGGPIRPGPYTPRPPHRSNQHYRAPRPQNGPIYPPSFTVPPPSMPGPSVPPPCRPPVPGNYPGYPMPQGPPNNQPYQNPMQQSSGFGQLPYAAQPQMDMRMVQFGTQFAQMVCNLQNSSLASQVHVPQSAPPSFNVPYNQGVYQGSQNSFTPFFSPPPPTYPATPFNSPSSMATLPPTNVPPPTGVPLTTQPPQPPPYTFPNASAPHGGQYTPAYSNYSNRR